MEHDGTSTIVRGARDSRVRDALVAVHRTRPGRGADQAGKPLLRPKRPRRV